MRITKFGHACVRLEHDGAVVVIDPGIFTEPEAVDGATAVLITHEHPDHLHPDNLAATDAPIHTIEAVAAKVRADAPDLAERVSVIEPGASFDVGVPVRAVGELHAVIHPEIPRITNSGYLLSLGDASVYHPGDALTAPSEPVDVLLAPSSAPWLRSEMAIDFVRDVGAPRNLAIHDRIYSEAGHRFLAAQMETLVGPRGQEWIRIADGEDL
ncbi:MAG TPA: MBL fold metallo-hydrolase [Nocardioides sp.]|nr:MBL fold metallo-hydrolase [Nocardioides sp.]